MTALSTATRSLARHPAHSALIVAVLAAGATLALALFTVFDAFLWRDPGFPAPDRVVQLVPERDGKRIATNVPSGVALYLRTHAAAFATVAMCRPESATLELGTNAAETVVNNVNADTFAVIGVRARLGRTFTSEEERSDDTGSVVLSESLWTERFARDPDVVGRRVRLAGRERVVIGVMPALVSPWKNDGLWCLEPTNERFARNFFYPTHRVEARLAPGVSVATAQAEFARLCAALAANQPNELNGYRVRPRAWRDEFSAPVRPLLTMLGGAAVGAALLAALNATGLFVARLHTRQHELAVRTALGASVSRVFQPLLLEGVFLSLVGVGFGTAAAALLPALLTRISADAIPRWMNVGFGPNTVLAAVTLAAVNAALLASEAFRTARRATGRESLATSVIADRRVRSFQRLLVVAQLAVSFAMAANAALLVHSWQSVRRIDSGLRLGGLWMSWLNVPAARYDTPEKIARLAADLEQSLQAAPGVSSAAVSTTAPLTSSVTFAFQRASVPVERAADLPRCVYYGVGQNYFATVGSRLVAGRFFSADDRAGSPRVAIVSESLARQYFPHGNALDQWIVPAVGPREWRRVIGIVADVKQGSILQSAPPQFYEPFAQSPVGGFVLFVRLGGAAPFSEASFRAAVSAVDATLAPRTPLPLDQYMAAQTAPARLAAQSLLTAAALAVLLAVAGFGALLVLTTAQRAREFGVRLTLGATPRQIVGLVVREGLLLAALGAAAGALGAWTLGQAAQATLYGTPPPALATFGVAGAVLVACVAVACALPAWRAARTDPALCLRSE